jgi:anti-anti-sigma factor
MWIRVDENPNGEGIFRIPGADAGVVCRMVRHVAVIDLKGAIIQERTFPLLQERIRELLDEGAKNFAVNLSEVPCADSYTLGGLAGAYNLIRQAGGRIKFFAASWRLVHTLKKLRLDTVLEFSENEASALSSFH